MVWIEFKLDKMTQLVEISANKTAKQAIGLSILSLLLLSFVQNAHAESASKTDNTSKIVKWKDDNNVTHYGDKIPVQYANRENSVISKHGITIERNKPIYYQDQALYLAKQEQDRKDKALLSAFTNENEIDLARDRNLQLDQVTGEGLQLQKINSQKRLVENQKIADRFMKTKKAIPADLATDIKSGQSEIEKQDRQISERKAATETTRKRFD